MNEPKVMVKDVRPLGEHNFLTGFKRNFTSLPSNLWGTLLENVKKSKINPPYCTVQLPCTV
jgi:hypothetical protein